MRLPASMLMGCIRCRSRQLSCGIWLQTMQARQLLTCNSRLTVTLSNFSKMHPVCRMADSGHKHGGEDDVHSQL